MAARPHVALAIDTNREAGRFLSVRGEAAGVSHNARPRPGVRPGHLLNGSRIGQARRVMAL